MACLALPNRKLLTPNAIDAYHWMPESLVMILVCDDALSPLPTLLRMAPQFDVGRVSIFVALCPVLAVVLMPPQYFMNRMISLSASLAMRTKSWVVEISNVRLI